MRPYNWYYKVKSGIRWFQTATDIYNTEASHRYGGVTQLLIYLILKCHTTTDIFYTEVSHSY